MSSPKLFRRGAMAIALAAAFAAHADENLRLPEVSIVPAQTYFPASGATDAERTNSLGTTSQINADAAYSRGITGRGVTVAVMDTGISAGNREFSEAGKLMAGYNAINGGTDVIDRAGHGTHVAGILAAGRDGSGIFGVAYDARLLPIKVLSDNGNGSTNYLDTGLRYAIGKAAIANFSLGATGVYNSSAMQQAVQAGMLIVAAAGNDGAANPDWPARFAKEGWANNQIIAVGAVDASNRIASFSNRAGDTAAWYLVAPGVAIYSSYLNNQYAYMSGTSMATPVVSAAAALLKQLWPTLRADQIADILFITATDLGDPGIDAVYGRGLLNLARALQPVGAVTTTTFNGRTVNVLGSALRPSAATSKLWSLAASGSLRVIGLDSYSRSFNVDLGANVVQPVPLSVSQVFGSMDSRLEVTEQVLGRTRLLAAFDNRLPAIGNPLRFDDAPHARRLSGYALVSQWAGGNEVALGAGGFAAQYFGIGGLPMAADLGLGSVPALAHPYFSLVAGASHGAIAHDFGGVKVKFGVLSSRLNGTLGSQEGPYLPTLPTNAWNSLPKANANLVEVSRAFGNAAMSVSFSQTREANAWLGAQSFGALNFGATGVTTAMQVAGAYLLAPKLALAGQASYGYTPGGYNNASLITALSGTRTNAFSLALVAADNLRRGDRFSVAVSQPMRTYAGSMTLNVWSGLTDSGKAVRDNLQLSMVPTGRELRTEMYYQMPVGRDASAGFSYILRRDPDNIAGAPAEQLVAARYSRQF
ncbi:Subtilase family protein [Noviherbaspirillum humi]|uniref:Subtilase family protein n=1 Tax=Noviherbaspirillum humi TaxID=1688639 RepID=A0A239BUC5_9BURK|nr:S8 family serine peptidase [Noviherbaspirillum humi]SNS11645.1 Subtilase family protein [Noviherbaspirillum humi]